MKLASGLNDTDLTAAVCPLIVFVFVAVPERGEASPGFYTACQTAWAGAKLAQALFSRGKE